MERSNHFGKIPTINPTDQKLKTSLLVDLFNAVTYSNVVSIAMCIILVGIRFYRLRYWL